MAKIIFYEKPGCVNNTKQKNILQLAGHEVDARSILTHKWNGEELMEYFEGKAVKDWFNPNAPAVNSGLVMPETYSSNEAITVMLQDHLLIKRPLINIDGVKIVGFDMDKLCELVDMEKNSAPEIQDILKDDLETCPQKKKVCD